MRSTTARLRFSEEELEGFISELWVLLERDELPSPDLRLFPSAPGTTTVELRFGENGIPEQFLRNWIRKRDHSVDVVTVVTANSFAAPFN
jgi:hypothetical protein